MESSADYSSGAAAATGRDVPPRPGEALTVLGLETSCDETAASVVRLHPSDRGGRAEVLSSVVHSQIDDHASVHKLLLAVIPDQLYAIFDG